ncbi:L-lactate dehydrogenase [Cutibacterium granulosum]|jgi:L-lactate dehydrogenase|uniref:L-lactate dehydrogenase n=1 Tax=Cutibacterium granulosum TM11 TaxID=1292373 RepID=A0ACB4UM61_9ACTN|nr:L-lactate dehydrogenase [Cutibacterium granulosum]MDU1778705.1 L-lactate dehydrogenase [Propionibacterium sp.]ERF63913.1 L-lactate dehydrogenase [Cutibacterium granulosum TM11]MBS5253638.1 L-lactate dehydrogenase [Cutibacterium granulosum]MDU1523925.1 L-lactate dehydrogenase [Cutibacterium granulosum]MDU1580709.1 L-lactate dehydrogenase [Cutibacterium granulosum]
MTLKAVNRRKISVIGAGSVGSSLAYACLIRGSADIVCLYDINKDKVEAEVADLAHGTQFTPASVMGGADIKDTVNSDIVFITAGAKQKPGQTRLDLAGVNAGILKSLMPQLLEQSPNALFVLVTNPCDVLTVVAQNISGLPSSRVFSTGTMLDTSRLRWLIRQWANVAQRHVHATIVGEHGDSEFPLWSIAQISGVPIHEWKVDGESVFTDEVLDDLAHEAAFAAYKIIEGKGATNYAIGLTGARLAEALLGANRSILPLSSVIDDVHGVKNVALSMPCIVSREGIEGVVPVPMSDGEITKLHASAERLKDSLSSLDI